MLQASTLADAVSCSPSWGIFVSGALFLLSAAVNLAVALSPVNIPPEEKKEELSEKPEEEKETVEA